jgi:hypothetical protein
MKAKQITLLPQVTTHDEGLAKLKQAGDATIIVRGVPRLLLMRCPCGCGDNLSINLDGRAGPAWRHYIRHGALTLFPSYWRDSHCGSHFILWKNQIHWCDWDDESYWNESAEIEGRVWEALTHDWVGYEFLADQLGEIPWDVLQACYSLSRRGRVEQHRDRRTGSFRKKALS